MIKVWIDTSASRPVITQLFNPKPVDIFQAVHEHTTGIVAILDLSEDEVEGLLGEYWYEDMAAYEQAGSIIVKVDFDTIHSYNMRNVMGKII
ncbi:hypothetical protein UGMREWDR_CDS0206 [Aeromonas phage GomatiRiver_11]|nr:hypothetical protein OBDJBBDK_00204 [Aeromonas phage AhFM11]WKW84373.1 hypothetical protein UGMREWDR_CDS0206 [Aeromonas phage GomatiRiver_11]